MEKKELLYEGKAKQVFKTDDPELYIQYFKDDATAFNALKKGTIVQKGMVNNQISSRLFELLHEHGIKTHFVKKLSDREMLVRCVDILKVEVVARNIFAGSLSKRLGVKEGVILKQPIVEYYYKDDDLGDPMINMAHIRLLELATDEQMNHVEKEAFKINEILRSFLQECNIDLVDMKMEFGLHNGEIILADEISPDTCRFWDKTTRNKLDKDRFRRDLGSVEEAYAEAMRRICDGQEPVG